MTRSSGANTAIHFPIGRTQSAIIAGLAFTAVLHAAPAAASSQFASGPFTLPEGITTGLNGTYILSDANNDEVYSIPAGGGTVTSGTPTNFRVFGEIALPSGYAQSGQYLAYGTDDASIGGAAALTGTSGLGAPNPVISTASGWFTDAVVAPTNYGTIRAGQVILGNDPGGVGSAIPSTIDILDSNSASVTTFATLPTGVGAFGVGFAPTTFGARAGDLFVSDVGTGNLYVIDATGNASLFASLPLPVGFSQPGLRQFAWAPAGFTLPDGQDLGGDLFVSIAAQNGGGGSTGEIDVLNGAGQTVAHYLEGGGATPLDPRGLLFTSPTSLLVANADPGVQELAPADFVGGFPAPEPSTWAMMLLGFAGLSSIGFSRRRGAPGRATPSGHSRREA
jgi:PEP-CTERM motif